MFSYIAHNSHEVAQLISTLIIIVLSMGVMLVVQYKKVAKLTKVAFFDPSTEMANGKFLNRVADKISAQAKIEQENNPKGEVWALFIDLISFDSIKSRAEKDSLAKGFAANLKRNLRPMDQCFRLGDGNFLVVITDPIDEDERERLMDTIEEFTKNIGILHGVVAEFDTNSMTWDTIAINPQSFYSTLGIAV